LDTSPNNDNTVPIDQTDEITHTVGGININNSAEELVSKFMNQTFYVNIRGKKVPFDIRDEIFTIVEPAQPIRSSTADSI
jgi:hypothetical protein